MPGPHLHDARSQLRQHTTPGLHVNLRRRLPKLVQQTDGHLHILPSRAAASSCRRCRRASPAACLPV